MRSSSDLTASTRLDLQHRLGARSSEPAVVGETSQDVRGAGVADAREQLDGVAAPLVLTAEAERRPSRSG